MIGLGMTVLEQSCGGLDDNHDPPWAEEARMASPHSLLEAWRCRDMYERTSFLRSIKCSYVCAQAVYIDFGCLIPPPKNLTAVKMLPQFLLLACASLLLSVLTAFSLVSAPTISRTSPGTARNAVETAEPTLTNPLIYGTENALRERKAAPILDLKRGQGTFCSAANILACLTFIRLELSTTRDSRGTNQRTW